MRGSEFLDKMELIDKSYIDEADTLPQKPKRPAAMYISAAACICLMLAAAFLLPYLNRAPAVTPIPSTSEESHIDGVTDGTSSAADTETEQDHTAETDTDTVDEPYIPYAFYNEATSIINAARAYVAGYFTEELDKDELSAVIPDGIFDIAEVHGTGGFNGNGEIIDVNAVLTVPETEKTIYLSIGTGHPYPEFDGEKVSYLANYNIYFTFFRFRQVGGDCLLGAYGELNGETVYLQMRTDPASLEEDQVLLAVAVDRLCSESQRKPDLSSITPDSIPEFIDKQLTFAQAMADVDFGGYLPDMPDGFTAGAARRYKDGRNDYLSAQLTSDSAQIDIMIYRADENDLERVTSAERTENYDLSLYPIPRARSVPDELRDIVNDPIFIPAELTADVVAARADAVVDEGDTDGVKCKFSVLYGDTVVNITAKGASPELLFELVSNRK